MIWFLMKRSTFVLISFIFCTKLFFELIQGQAFLFAASFQRFWSSKAFIHPRMSLPTQSQVQSTVVPSMLALVIVERESRQRLQHLIMVHALAHPPIMRSWITLWHPSMTYAPRCSDLLLSCTITTSVVIRSSLLSRPNWTKSKGS